MRPNVLFALVYALASVGLPNPAALTLWNREDLAMSSARLPASSRHLVAASLVSLLAPPPLPEGRRTPLPRRGGRLDHARHEGGGRLSRAAWAPAPVYPASLKVFVSPVAARRAVAQTA